MFFDERLHLRDTRRDGVTRHIAHRWPHQNGQILLSYRLQGTPGEGREDEIVIIQDILRDSDGHQKVEGLDRWDMLPQPQKIMIGLVVLTTVDGVEEGALGRLDAPLIHRLEL